MNIDDSNKVLDHEIIDSKALLKKKLKNEINAFVGSELKKTHILIMQLNIFIEIINYLL